jgi:predicted  nucleic acid-binding Zn-ribbon protein/sulfur carrier protein ThiS
MGMVPTNYIRPVNTQQTPSFRTPMSFNPSVYNSVKAEAPQVMSQDEPSKNTSPGKLSPGAQHALALKEKEVAAQRKLLEDLGFESNSVSGSFDHEPEGLLSPGSPRKTMSFALPSPPTIMIPPTPNAVPKGVRFQDPMMMNGSDIPLRDEKEVERDVLANTEKAELDCLTTLADLSAQMNMSTQQLVVVKRNIIILGEDHRRVDDYVRMCEVALKGQAAPVTADPGFVSPALSEYLNRCVRELDTELVALLGKHDALKAQPVQLPLQQTNNDNEHDDGSGSSTVSSEVEFREQICDELEPEVEEIEEEELVYVAGEPEIILEEVEYQLQYDDGGRPTNLLDEVGLESLSVEPALRKQLVRLHRKYTEGSEMLQALIKHENKLNKKYSKLQQQLPQDGTVTNVTDEEVEMALHNVQAQQEALAAREAAVKEFEQRVAELNTAIEPVQKQCAKYEKKFAAGKAENAALQEQLQTTITKRDDMLTQKLAFEETLKTLQREGAKLQAERQEMQVKLENVGLEVKQQVRVMNEKLEGVRQKTAQYAADLARLKEAAAAK